MDDEHLGSTGRCRFCKRWGPILDGRYTRVRFPDGVANVCDDCASRADRTREEDVVIWRGAEVEVVD